MCSFCAFALATFRQPFFKNALKDLKKRPSNRKAFCNYLLFKPRHGAGGGANRSCSNTGSWRKRPPPQRAATMCAEAGKIGCRRIPSIKNARVARALFLVYQALFGNSPSSRLVRLQPLNICFCQAFLFSLLLSSFLFVRKEKEGKTQMIILPGRANSLFYSLFY